MILEIARDVSDIMRVHKIKGAVIGGVAVVLHGHVRTTLDVDVFVPDPAERLTDALRSEGFVFRRERKEFVKPAFRFTSSLRRSWEAPPANSSGSRT